MATTLTTQGLIQGAYPSSHKWVEAAVAYASTLVAVIYQV